MSLKTQVAKRDAVVRARLVELLDPYEVNLLARYVGDGMTQTEIGLADGDPQTTVGHRIRRLVKRLADAGIDVPMPGRSPATDPDRGGGRLVYCEPSALDRLVPDPVDPGEPRSVVRGRWPEGKKLDAPDDGRADDVARRRRDR